MTQRCLFFLLFISIHTFLVEGDVNREFTWDEIEHLSTPSLRKVTKTVGKVVQTFAISIHTFLAEGDINCSRPLPEWAISIHTFLAEGDAVALCAASSANISIHTFLAEGDSLECSSNASTGYFNPHLPCGR